MYPRQRPQTYRELTQYQQKALEAHIHVLWGLSNANAVPTDPPEQLLKNFESRFSMSTETDLYQQFNNGPSLVLPSLVQITVSIPSNSRSKLAASIKRMEEHILEYMQTCLSKFGLWCWCPDLRQSPYSLYNAACRIVALDTFKQALVSHSYAHFNPNISYTKNLAFLVRLYDHIVHHYIYSRYKQDIKKPGSVRIADSASPQYHNRTRVSDTWFLIYGVRVLIHKSSLPLPVFSSSETIAIHNATSISSIQRLLPMMSLTLRTALKMVD